MNSQAFCPCVPTVQPIITFCEFCIPNASQIRACVPLPIGSCIGAPSALAQVTVPASQVALSQIFVFFQSIFQTAARVIFLKCMCCHQVTPLFKNYSGFCAFRKKFKLLNLCGFSCLGPSSFHSHLLPLLICDILFYFLLEIKCGQSTSPSVRGDWPMASPFCSPEGLDSGRRGMSPHLWEARGQFLRASKTSGILP